MANPPVEVDDRALLGALVALKRLDSEAKKEVTRTTRTVLTPAWKHQLARAASNPRTAWPGRGGQAVLLGPGKVKAGVGGSASVVAWTGRRLSGGLDTWQWVEFGAGNYPQLPARNAKGRIAYDASKRFRNTAVKTWLRAIADACREVPGVEDG